MWYHKPILKITKRKHKIKPTKFQHNPKTPTKQRKKTLKLQNPTSKPKTTIQTQTTKNTTNKGTTNNQNPNNQNF